MAMVEARGFSPEGADSFESPDTTSTNETDKSLSDIGRERWESAKELTVNAAEKAGEFGQQKWESAKEFAAGVLESGRQRFDNVRERASGLGTRTKDSVKNFFNRAKAFGFALLAPDVAVKRGAEKTAEVSTKAYNWSAERVSDSYEFACTKAEQLGTAAEAVKNRTVERVNAVKEKTAEKATGIKNSVVEKAKAWGQSYVEKVQNRATERQVAKLVSQREKYVKQFEDLPATLEALKAQIAHIEQMMDVLPQRVESTNEIIKQLQAA